MFGILWFLFFAVLISMSVVWVIDNDGTVLVSWLSYEVRTDILTAIILAVFIASLIFAFTYLFARILSIKFPNLLKLFFKKSYTKQLEKIIHKHHQAFDLMADALFALDAGNVKLSEKLYDKFNKSVKSSHLNIYFSARMAILKEDFEKAIKSYERIHEVEEVENLAYKARLKLAMKNKDNEEIFLDAEKLLQNKRNKTQVINDLNNHYSGKEIPGAIKDLIQKNS